MFRKKEEVIVAGNFLSFMDLGPWVGNLETLLIPRLFILSDIVTLETFQISNFTKSFYYNFITYFYFFKLSFV